MNKAEIRKLVESFLEGQSPKFSQIWKSDILSRLINLESGENIEPGSGQAERERNLNLLVLTKIETLHEQKLQNLIARCEAILKKTSDLDHEQINYVVFGAFLKWLDTFAPERSIKSANPELHWLMLLVKQAASEYFRSKDSRLEYVDLNEGFKFQADATAQQALEDIILERKEMDLDDEFQTVKFRIVDGFGGNSKKLPIKKQVALVASREILRYYLLTKRAGYPTRTDELPPLVGTYRHNLIKFINFHQQTKGLTLALSLLNTDSVTGYYKMRHHVLRNANSRRWMEMTVSELKKSRDKKIIDLSNAGNDLVKRDSIAKAPLLSSVVVCTNGRVFTCFKGQVNETISEGSEERDITWDKHCEYSLFVDVIKDENLPLLRGAILFVTLEPCNWRKGTGRGHARKPKIPCAVRCLEAGLRKVYIGSFDYNESIRGNGIEILRTGIYEFQLEYGNHKGRPDEIEGSALLEEYFKSKHYPLIEDGPARRKYKIGEPLEVAFFDGDLMFEIYNLNGQFQHKQINEEDPGTYEFGVF